MANEDDLTPEGGTPEATPQEPSPVEQRAMEQGWVPQEEWTGDPDDWRPAKEFVDRGELFKKIDDLRRENKAIKQGVDEFRKHHEEMKAVEFRRALAFLREQKKEALAEGDHDRVVELDDKIAETREAQREAPKQVQQPAEPHPEFVRWTSRNGWYGTERAMKAFADDVAREMVGRGITDPPAILAEVDKQVRKEFPHKFENPRRAAAAPVEGSTKTGRSAAKDDVVLSEQEKSIMNKIVRSGVMTKEQYLTEFKARKSG
jgi:hypothetical protein